ncbi:hypothetical protein K8R43_06325 [archaeon]|nr:hypothetical protein [archaeon]
MKTWKKDAETQLTNFFGACVWCHYGLQWKTRDGRRNVQLVFFEERNELYLIDKNKDEFCFVGKGSESNRLLEGWDTAMSEMNVENFLEANGFL